MAYVVVENFKAGLDTRRPAVAGEPGTLIELDNAHITRGGDIESRKKFVSTFTLPAGTVGLHAVGGTPHVFGAAAEPAGMPAGVTYQRLQPTGGQTMTELLSATNFAGKIYAVALYDDGSIFHFYDGSRVTGWDAIALAISDLNTVASALADLLDEDDAVTASAVGAVITVTAATAGTPYTLTASTENGGAVDDQAIAVVETQANRVATSEVLSSGTFEVTGGAAGADTFEVKVDGVTVTSAAVAWGTSNSATATAIASNITANTSTPDYDASAAGPVITITAKTGTGSGPNGFLISHVLVGAAAVGSVTDFAGGVDAVTALAQTTTLTLSGTYEVNDIWTATLNAIDFKVSGAASGTGTFAMTYRAKVYSPTNSLLYFSAVNNPEQFGSGTGSGFINMSSQNSGSETLRALATYNSNMAIFADRVIQIWSIDEDPDLNAYVQALENTGTSAPRSVLSFGSKDVFYLDDTGIRSLRARDSSNLASVNDVGVAIDDLIETQRKAVTETEFNNAIGVIEPRDGRFWLIIKNKIFVLSFFPGSKISAWSTYTPGFDISDVATVGRRLYARSSDTIYLYGGSNGTTYPAAADNVTVTARLPFLGAGRIANLKELSGFDMACTGEWNIEVLLNPADETETVSGGIVTETTFRNGIMTLPDGSTHFAPKLTSTKGGRVTLSQMIVHFDQEDAD